MSSIHPNPNDPNIQLLEIVAVKLGVKMLNRLIFVVGLLVSLLIPDPYCL